MIYVQKFKIKRNKHYIGNNFMKNFNVNNKLLINLKKI